MRTVASSSGWMSMCRCAEVCSRWMWCIWRVCWGLDLRLRVRPPTHSSNTHIESTLHQQNTRRMWCIWTSVLDPQHTRQIHHIHLMHTSAHLRVRLFVRPPAHSSNTPHSSSVLLMKGGLDVCRHICTERIEERVLARASRWEQKWARENVRSVDWTCPYLTHI